MKKFGTLKIVLSAIALSLSACKSLEDAPEYWQCQYNGNPRAFYCVNSKTGERKKIRADSSEMKAAQCVNAEDYRELEAYKDYLIDQAQQRCN